jgi:hypothetical protein
MRLRDVRMMMIWLGDDVLGKKAANEDTHHVASTSVLGSRRVLAAEERWGNERLLLLLHRVPLI